MKKNTRRSIVLSSAALLLALVYGTGIFLERMSYGKVFSSVAYAEDDENDEGDTEDRTASSSNTTSSSSSSETPTYKTVYVEKVITTLDPIYTTDTDKDGLVDGLDPHPTIPESEYFTDTDGDGVPNAFDKHHDEDDFAYFEEETDTNNNGILDSYESSNER